MDISFNGVHYVKQSDGTLLKTQPIDIIHIGSNQETVPAPQAREPVSINELIQSLKRCEVRDRVDLFHDSSIVQSTTPSAQEFADSFMLFRKHEYQNFVTNWCLKFPNFRFSVDLVRQLLNYTTEFHTKFGILQIALKHLNSQLDRDDFGVLTQCLVGNDHYHFESVSLLLPMVLPNTTQPLDMLIDVMSEAKSNHYKFKLLEHVQEHTCLRQAKVFEQILVQFRGDDYYMSKAVELLLIQRKEITVGELDVCLSHLQANSSMLTTICPLLKHAKKDVLSRILKHLESLPFVDRYPIVKLYSKWNPKIFNSLLAQTEKELEDDPLKNSLKISDHEVDVSTVPIGKQFLFSFPGGKSVRVTRTSATTADLALFQGASVQRLPRTIACSIKGSVGFDLSLGWD